MIEETTGAQSASVSLLVSARERIDQMRRRGDLAQADGNAMGELVAFFAKTALTAIGEDQEGDDYLPLDVASTVHWFSVEFMEKAHWLLRASEELKDNPNDAQLREDALRLSKEFERFVSKSRYSITIALSNARRIQTLFRDLEESGNSSKRLLESLGRLEDAHHSFKNTVIAALDRKAQTDASESFTEKKGRHRKREYCLYGAVGLGALALGLVLKSWASAPVDPWLSERDFYMQVGIRLAVITAIASAVQAALRRSNLERNLRIMYEHRIAAITQAPAFIASFADDEESRSLARSELARLVFSDPTTGYREVGAGEVSLGPILAVKDQLESMSKKKP